MSEYFFETYDAAGSFITSDNPAFEHKNQMVWYFQYHLNILFSSLKEMKGLISLTTVLLTHIRLNILIGLSHGIERLDIDTNETRRKRTGLDGVIHFIPGLFNNDFNFRLIEKKTAKMIIAQASGYEEVHYIDTTELYDEDVQLIAKDNKIYYLPEQAE